MEALGWGVLPTVHLTLLIGVAVAAHLAIRRARRPLLDRIHDLSEGPTHGLAAFADTIVVLLYVAYIAATFSFEGASGANVVEADRVLDSVAVFAIFIALTNLLSLGFVFRRSFGLDGWPNGSYRPAQQV